MEPIKWIFRFKYMHLLTYFADVIWAYECSHGYL